MLDNSKYILFLRRDFIVINFFHLITPINNHNKMVTVCDQNGYNRLSLAVCLDTDAITQDALSDSALIR